MATKNFKFIQSFFLLGAIILFSQCTTEEPEPENEEELITTLEMIFEPASGGEAVIFSIYDEDGDGPIPPVYTNGILAANTSYNVEIEVRNDIENEDITEEVSEEALEHQFFFQISNGLNLNFAYNDADDNGNPIGIESTFTAGDGSSGSLTVELRHEPNKSAEGAVDGDPTNVGGETDIQATFDVVIE